MSKVNGHEARINDVLRVAYQREGLVAINYDRPFGFEEIFEAAPGDGEEAMRIRMETAIRLALFLCQKGAHPGWVVRFAYLYLQRVKPEMILNMNGAELADMLGETRAAFSARLQAINAHLKAKNGAKAVTIRTQKSTTSRRKYASAARGNTNRRGKYKRAA